MPQYQAGGIDVICPHCNNREFELGSAQLNTRGATFLNLDWLNKSAAILTCTKCGFILWFKQAPVKQ